MREIQKIILAQEQEQHHWPFDIILSVFSFVRLIDLGRLLRQASGDRNFLDYCSYAIQTRAKAEAWELAFYTPAGYMAALCHGDRKFEAIGRLRCIGYDTQAGLLRFEPPAADEGITSNSNSVHSVMNTHDLPSSLKLICAQWPYPPTAEDQTHNISILWSPGIYRQQLGACGDEGYIQFSIIQSQEESQEQHHDQQRWGDMLFCNQCQRNHPHHNNNHNNNNHQNKMKIRFQSALVTFEWLRQGLLQ
ncbi:hypothetical protein BDA99DRAFT_560604 [Phascolomyces articulosus]|uniref:Uncharacterized protein n=1 Tax=Phascolomyces articulosus TaxID=60185 RepID=A0AAD5JY76_9FUNG|nr:hypothetical protein BDA99DRAFT_560604 [Phascolomyces articulosus]